MNRGSDMLDEDSVAMSETTPLHVNTDPTRSRPRRGDDDFNGNIGIIAGGDTIALPRPDYLPHPRARILQHSSSLDASTVNTIDTASTGSTGSTAVTLCSTPYSSYDSTATYGSISEITDEITEATSDGSQSSHGYSALSPVSTICRSSSTTPNASNVTNAVVEENGDAGVSTPCVSNLSRHVNIGGIIRHNDNFAANNIHDGNPGNGNNVAGGIHSHHPNNNLPSIPSMTAPANKPPHSPHTSASSSSVPESASPHLSTHAPRNPRNSHNWNPFQIARITTSTTLVFCGVTILLCISTFVRYIVFSPNQHSNASYNNNNNNKYNDKNRNYNSKYLPFLPGWTTYDDDDDYMGQDDYIYHGYYNGGKTGGGKDSDGAKGGDGKKKNRIRNRQRKNKRLFDESGRYIIEDYDALPTFSDFLPGVAGIYGKPVWSFYVNRGQGIASFGVQSKDYPIMEFYSANKAYQNTALLGFRTFYQGRRGNGGGIGGAVNGGNTNSFLIEPFDPARTRYEQLNPQSKESSQTSSSSSYTSQQTQSSQSSPLLTSPAEWANLPTRTMYIGTNEMQIREVDHIHKIETNVTYFTLPEEDFGALVRRTTIANIDNDKPIHLSILDGLARIEPVGGKLNILLKTIGRTLEGWMGVYDADDKTMPFYRMSTVPADTAAVFIEDAGHYCLSYIENREYELLPIVYDTSKVFGEDTTLLRPLGLFGKTVKDIIEGAQFGSAKTSSAFAAVNDVTIYPRQSITVTTFYGKANSIADIPVIARRISQVGFAQYKLSRARELIQQITAGVETNTANKLFDGHVQQMYLDNSLRGGIPVLLGEVDDNSRSQSADDDHRLKVYHLFSRVHGDLERDYNDFVIEPTFFSEGPGNFRDIAQNRRNDVVINPRIGSFNVKLFLSFIQADGYNPLSVEAVVFTIDDKDECDRIATLAVGHADGHRAQRESLASILCGGPFRPGQLAELIANQRIILLTSLPDLIDNVASVAKVSPMAVSKDGFWADHWTYYMDLIESFIKIYPDREETLLFDEKLPYYFSPRIVLPRSEKYVLSTSFNGKWHHVRQLEASVIDTSRFDIMKKYVNNSSGWFKIEANYQHDKGGNIYRSSPIAKLFLLGTLKFATRDPYGMGIEYEGGKPGWNDAMNGLVGMVGSGLPETYELEVLLSYIQKVVKKYQRPIVVPKELADLINEISDALHKLDESGYINFFNSTNVTLAVPPALFDYWDSVATARENYRKKTPLFSGLTHEYSSTETYDLLERWIAQVDLGIERALAIGSHGEGDDNSLGITPTYFSFNVTKWKETGKKNKQGHPFVNAEALSVGRFPLFLEGVVRMMKTVGEPKARSIYNNVKRSGLRDEELGMYTLSSSLDGQSYDMGRMMAFSPGWLENQSVWTHMSYKYYLEILKKEMYDVFYEEMLSGMLPFVNDKAYGRSLLECSSFIVSSAFVDPSMRGRGFLARLSGTTAEFLSIWVLMMIGPSPFFVNEETGLLEMQLVPALPLWFFRNEAAAGQDHKFSIHFRLFASINVVYYNLQARDLFGVSPQKYEIGLRDGSRIKVKGPTIPNDLATNIRRVVFIDYIHAYF